MSTHYYPSTTPNPTLSSTASILCWNANGLLTPASRQCINKLPLNISIIGITETHFPNPIPNHRSYRISSFPYSLHHSYKKDQGGISFYSRHPIYLVKELNPSSSSSSTSSANYHSLYIRSMGQHGKPIIIGICYHRSIDKSSFPNIINGINRAVEYCNKQHLSLLIMGDFNAHHNEWNGIHYDQHGEELFDCIIDNQLTVINSYFPSSKYIPTHHRGNVLDLFLTNNPSLWKNCNVDSNNDLHLISDHHPIHLEWNTNPRSSSSFSSSSSTIRYRYTWNIKKADWNQYNINCRYLTPQYHNRIQSIISNTSNNIISPNDGIEMIWSELLSLLDYATSNSVPQSIMNYNRSHYWWKIIVHENEKDYLREYRRCRHYYNEHHNPLDPLYNQAKAIR